MCKITSDMFCNNLKRISPFGFFKVMVVSMILTNHNNAQNFSEINSKSDSYINFESDYTDNNVANLVPFDKLSYRFNNNTSLFNSKVFLELENSYHNEVVYFSKNDKFGFDIPLSNYENNHSKLMTTSNVVYNQEIHDYRNYSYIKEKLVSEDFIGTVERNLFYYSYNANKNNIYTTEFSVLSFQSAEASQYLSGTKIWGGIGFGMFGALMLLPQSVTKWEDDYIEDATSNFNRAFSQPPVWDEDHWEINYIGHPYAGSLYYNTIRSKGGTVFRSFLFSAFVSTGWEYLYEGMAEQPSIQDLVVTPVVGSILGELIHQATSSMKKNGYNFWEAAFVTIFNPMEVIQNGYK